MMVMYRPPPDGAGRISSLTPVPVSPSEDSGGKRRWLTRVLSRATIATVLFSNFIVSPPSLCRDYIRHPMHLMHSTWLCSVYMMIVLSSMLNNVRSCSLCAQ
jgi:hypothetical protein